MNNNETIISSLKPVVAKMARELVDAMKSKHGIDLMITSGYRSIAAQDAIYAQGRTTPGSIVTNAKGGQSFHNFGVAFDCVPLIGGKPIWTSQYIQTAQEASIIGLEHGDRGYIDLPHFECRLGYSLEDFQNGKVNWNKYELSALENNQTNHMEPTKSVPAAIKWTKFYDSASKTVATYYNDTKVLANDGQTFEFATEEEMLSKSTVETFNFWDNVPMGVGRNTA